jgi:hypothetical protein
MITAALRIEAVSFFEAQRRKRYSEKPGAQRNAQNKL